MKILQDLLNGADESGAKYIRIKTGTSPLILKSLADLIEANPDKENEIRFK